MRNKYICFLILFLLLIQLSKSELQAKSFPSPFIRRETVSFAGNIGDYISQRIHFTEPYAVESYRQKISVLYGIGFENILFNSALSGTEQKKEYIPSPYVCALIGGTTWGVAAFSMYAWAHAAFGTPINYKDIGIFTVEGAGLGYGLGLIANRTTKTQFTIISMSILAAAYVLMSNK